MATVDQGLRARKKAQTRRALTEAALRLYRRHGFDGVTIAGIAEEAGVAPRTFFGYFEAKEDVFLGRGDERLERLVRAILERDRRVPILEAVRGELFERTARNRSENSAERPHLAELLRHPAIANRLRERWNRWEDQLAAAIAKSVRAEAGDPAPRVVAAALTGAIRIASAAAQQQPGRRTQIAARVFELLSSGLAGYGAVTRK